MDNRYEHQDRTIKDISHFISTFQLTLKAVGGKDQPTSPSGGGGGGGPASATEDPTSVGAAQTSV